MQKRIIHHITKSTTDFNQIPKLLSSNSSTFVPHELSLFKSFSSDRRKGSGSGGDDEWNDAWETAWLPDDLSGKNRSPWESYSFGQKAESDVNFGAAAESSNISGEAVAVDDDVDVETKAFVEDMNENWNEIRKGPTKNVGEEVKKKNDESLYSLDKMKKDYRLSKQRIHAGLWMNEIHKQQESFSTDSIGDDIDRLLDSCSEIFNTPNNELNDSEGSGSSEFMNKPDGWETTSKGHDGNIWEMSLREEDILLQEFDRRIAYSKFQIASFIKTHIFSRRRPIDGWKYMIEELGPNAKKGKGSVSRLPTLSDPSTQPFKEERAPSTNRAASYKGR